MGEGNLEEFAVALQGEGPLRGYLEGFEEHFKAVTASETVESLSSVLPDVDKAVITEEFGEDLAFVQPWGFELNEISVPTMIWQGEADLMVPFAHREWLASRLPLATVHLEQGQGHLSLGVGALDRMLDEPVSVL
jgi:pimeloyl-ACP methyl ester carboxylesterase